MSTKSRIFVTSEENRLRRSTMATTGALCAVEGCRSSRKKNKNLSFFYLPTEPARRKAWAELINRPDLADPTRKTNSFVCSLHFHSNNLVYLPRLQPDALPSRVPCINQPDEETTKEISTQTEYSIIETKNTPVQKITIGNKRPVLTQTAVMVISYTPPAVDSELPTSEEPGPSKRKQVDETSELDEPIIKQRKVYTDLHTDLDIKEENDEFEQPLSPEPYTFETDPLATEDEATKRFNDKIIEWKSYLDTKLKYTSYPSRFYSSQVKLFALNLYLSSPEIFRRARKLLSLPSEHTIQKFRIIIPLKLEERTMTLLAAKLYSMPENAKYCTLCISKIALKRHLHYDTKRDEIIGLHNSNGDVLPEAASQAVVIMLNGFIINWTQVIAYSFISTLKQYDSMCYWLDQVLLKLAEIGIKVKAIVTEQGSPFERYFKYIKTIKKEKPYFFFEGEKIYCIYEVPHLLKCVRNHLLTNNFIYGDTDKKVSWEHLGALSKLLEKNLILGPNITSDHVQPNEEQKLEVKYAAQIFSNSVHAALNFHIENKDLPEEAKGTAEFVEMMNNVFDILNSSPGKSINQYKRAFSLKDYQIGVLEDAYTIFSKLKVIGTISGSDYTKNIRTFKSFNITIRAIIMLAEDLKKEGTNYLYTRRLNLESLQSFFCTMIKRNGNKVPIPIQFQRLFSKLFLSNILKNPLSTYSEVDISRLQNFSAIFESLVPEPTCGNKLSTIDLKGDIDYRIDLPSKNPLVYVAAFLLYKCNDKHTCPEFASQLNDVPDLTVTASQYEHFKGLNRTSKFFNKLKVPSDEFYDYVTELEKKFVEYFRNNIGNMPGSTLYELLIAVPFNPPCDCVPLGYIVKLFIRLRLFYIISFNNRQLEQEKNANNIVYVKLKPLL